MEHRSLQEISGVARIEPERAEPRAMTKKERLERWAESLEAQRGRRLRALEGLEYAKPRERAAMRADDTALTVAYQDPALFASGLSGDSYGEAREFFGLSNAQMHALLCDCYHGQTMSAQAVACHVRSLALRAEQRGRQVVANLVTGALAASTLAVVLAAIV